MRITTTWKEIKAICKQYNVQADKSMKKIIEKIDYGKDIKKSERIILKKFGFDLFKEIIIRDGLIRKNSKLSLEKIHEIEKFINELDYETAIENGFVNDDFKIIKAAFTSAINRAPLSFDFKSHLY